MVGPEPTNWRARFLYELRLSRPPLEGKKKLTQAEFADELVAGGINLGADPRVRYNRLEKGRDESSDELLAAVAKLYDVPAPTPPQVRAEESAVAAAIKEQTAALKDLAQAIREAFTTIDQHSQKRGKEIMRRLADIAVEVGVPQPEREPADTAANTQDADVSPDRAKHRTHRGRKARLGLPRPGWDEEPVEPELQSRSVG